MVRKNELEVFVDTQFMVLLFLRHASRAKSQNLTTKID